MNIRPMFRRGKPPCQELKFTLNLEDVQEEVVDEMLQDGVGRSSAGQGESAW